MKNFGLFFLSGVIVALLIKIFLFPVEKEIRVEIPAEAVAAVKADVTNINQKISKNGFEHTVHKDKENVIKSIAQLNDSSKYWATKYFEEVGIKEKQARVIAAYEATVKAYDLEAEKTATGFSYSDQWAKIEYKRSKDSVGNGHFNFSYNAEVNYSEYWKRKHFLAPKKHYIDFWINDPRATVNGVKRIKFETKEPTFGLDVSGKALYNGVDQKVYVGGEASLDIGKVNLSGAYLYAPAVGKWFPFVSGKYSLLSF